MKFSVHPLFFVVLISSAFFGGFFVCIIFVLTALLHECGHAFCAARLGYRCSRIRLMPYGAAAVCEIDGIKPRDEVVLAMAGPAVNAAICVALAGLWWFFPQTYAYTDVIMFASLSMLAVNLLPAYPLDGGRVFKCLLCRFMPRKTAAMVLKAVNFAVSAVFAALFFVSGYNPTFALFAAFLFCSAFEREVPAVRINFVTRAALKRGLEVKTVLVSEDITVKEAVRLLDDRHYTVLRTEGGREMEQRELCEVISNSAIYDKVFGQYGNN